jgi:secreted PhoX family phosphatase
MAHEGAWFGPTVEGKPLVVYMGDDSRNEYVYKYVSKASWSAADSTLGLRGGDKYLDDGTLYVARFDADGSGEWLLLGKDNPALEAFADQADIVINARSAGDAAGATKMDRPEWGGVHPASGEFYVSLTNNSTRGTSGPAVDAANPRSYAELRGETSQTGNPNGHILRLRETGGEGAATTFSWDVYLFGAQADADPATVNLSALSADNDFSSPDGLWFDRRGVLWIQTDDGAYTDVTNCMMLAAVPGKVGDGVETSVAGQRTFVGKAPGDDALRRFLVGVPGSEITGVDLTPDNKTLIVGIQHPGETGTLDLFQSNWPASSGADAALPGAANNRPRTATIVIRRTDGGDIGT